MYGDMLMRHSYSKCGDHFTMYTHIKLFVCIPETNVICQLYLKNKGKINWRYPIQRNISDFTVNVKRNRVIAGSGQGVWFKKRCFK